MVSKILIVGCVAGIIAVIGILVIFSSAPQHIVQQSIPYVTIDGGVTTTGMGTKPVFVDFISDTGTTTSATASGTSYSITLENQHSYSMTVHYSSGFGLSSGTCNAGTLSVYSSSSEMSENISC